MQLFNVCMSDFVGCDGVERSVVIFTENDEIMEKICLLFLKNSGTILLNHNLVNLDLVILRCGVCLLEEKRN